MINKLLLFIVLPLLFSACVGSIPKTEFGVKDLAVEKKIKNNNLLIEAYNNKNYKQVETILKSQLKEYALDNYALIRINNELSQLYSFDILDIEEAVKIDEKIIKFSKSKLGNSKYILRHTAANNVLLTSKWHKKKFVDISFENIQKLTSKRMTNNKKLLNAKISSNKIYSKKKLLNVLKISNDNYKKTYEKSQDRYKAISKIIKREYELYRTTKKIKYIKAYKYFANKELELNDVFLDEIDFISLSEFFQLSYQKTNDIKYAELSLYSIYKPYLNIRDEKNRLVYNSLVNKYINILIDENYKQNRYKDMLYYISLNKSRMIYEDILRNNNISTSLGININDSELNKLTGLPRKDIVFSKISSSKEYLDFYVAGKYIIKNVSKNPKLIQIKPTATRSFLVNKKTKKVETIQEFQSKNIYVTYINNSKIKVHKISTNKTKLIRKHLNAKYYRLIQHQKNNLKPKKSILDIFIPFKVGKNIVVSTDKFISKYPLDFFMNKNIIKTTNMFTYKDSDKTMKNINIVGYFNPTLDLINSEKEIKLIEKSFNNLKAFKREKATLNKLKEDINRNILHLSMHGINDAINPQQSMLLFAGSVEKGILQNESLTLKAQNMRKFSQLKNNDLVFTAACETGLTKETKSNSSEIEGILRPLLINNNKNIILTLWQVPDNSAKDFVNYFYDYLSKNKQIKKSFILAKNKLKKKYKSPVDWAPYYLIQN